MGSKIQFEETPQVTVALQRSLTELTDSALTTSITDSANACKNFSRSFMGELRGKLLPLLDEAARRINEGQSVNNCETLGKFYESLGINPVTVRSWRMRAKELKELPAQTQKETFSETPTQLEKSDGPNRLKETFKVLKLSEVKANLNELRNSLSDDDRNALAKELAYRGRKLLKWAKEFDTAIIEGEGQAA